MRESVSAVIPRRTARWRLAIGSTGAGAVRLQVGDPQQEGADALRRRAAVEVEDIAHGHSPMARHRFHEVCREYRRFDERRRHGLSVDRQHPRVGQRPRGNQRRLVKQRRRRQQQVPRGQQKHSAFGLARNMRKIDDPAQNDVERGVDRIPPHG